MKYSQPRSRSRVRQPRCPVCGAPAAPEHRPFCSRRCGDVDLGRWLGGSYAIAGEPVAGDGSEFGRTEDANGEGSEEDGES